MADAADEAAAIIAENRLTRRRLPSLPAECRPRDEVAAYRVQNRVHARLREAGWGDVTGHKIGCTTDIMQRYLGIDRPCAGGVLSRNVRQRSGDFRVGDFCRVGVECELVVRLSDDLPARATPYERDAVAPAIGSWMAGIEIVDDRYVDYRALDVWTLVADDFFQAACVLSDECRDPVDPFAVRGRMSINGEPVGGGTGRDILGDPLAALAWLANARIREDRLLKAGEFVFLGSMARTQWVSPGDRVTAALDGIGRAEALFV